MKLEHSDTIDEKLQNLAINNWAMFIALVGIDSVIEAKVCILKDEGKSWNQISQKLNISVMRARTAYKKRKAVKI